MIGQQRRQIRLDAVQGHQRGRRELTARTVEVNLDFGIAAVLHHADVIGDVPRAAVQRCHPVHIARRTRAGITAVGEQIAQVDTVRIRRAFPGADGKAVHHIVTVTTRGIRRVDELIEQRVVAAAADIEGVVSAPAFELVITAVAGNDIVEVRAVDPFNVQQPRGAKPGVLRRGET